MQVTSYFASFQKALLHIIQKKTDTLGHQEGRTQTAFEKIKLRRDQVHENEVLTQCPHQRSKQVLPYGRAIKPQKRLAHVSASKEAYFGSNHSTSKSFFFPTKITDGETQ